jgi:hypothetical protein
MAQPTQPPGIDHASEQGQSHIPTSLPAQPSGQPLQPPGINHASEQGASHIPTSLPAQPDHPVDRMVQAIASFKSGGDLCGGHDLAAAQETPPWQQHVLAGSHGS